MEYQEENQYMRKSQIKPPTTFAIAKGLSEITEANGNSRLLLPSKMPQPSSSLKRVGDKSSNEPEPKRKTLMERAAEPISSHNRTPSVPRPAVKGTSLVGLKNTFAQSRNTSITSSNSSRTPSVSSRHTSNSSFSASVGPGHRSKSAAGSRPQTSMSTTRPTTSTSKSRQNSDDEEMPPPTGGKRKGMRRSLLPTPNQNQFRESTLEIRKLRPHESNQSIPDVSVSTAMSRLNIDEEQTSPSKMHQAKSSNKKGSGLHHRQSLSMAIQSEENYSLVKYEGPGNSSVAPKTPSQIPQYSPYKSSANSPTKSRYLTKDSNVPGITEWDIQQRVTDMEAMINVFKASMSGTQLERDGLEEAVGAYKAKLNEIENIRVELSSSNKILHTDLDETKQRLETIQQRLRVTSANLDDNMRAHRIEIDEMSREHLNEVSKLRRDNADEVDRLLREHREELREMERKAATGMDDRIRDLERRSEAQLEEERNQRLREVKELESQVSTGHQGLNMALQMKEQELQIAKGELDAMKARLDREQELKQNANNMVEEMRQNMQKTSMETTSTIGSLESTVASLRARILFLESGSKAQSDSFVEMERRLQEAVDLAEVSKQKLIKEETLRRILFNQVQELKGNIRVMCRVRPTFKQGAEGECAKMMFPDTDKESKELQIIGKEKKSTFGNVTRDTHAFSFDRVFGPSSQNEEVFGEISQLVQSALDGYNVCIFCYGQTGAGKTHTMSSADGMIPRATHQIYESATNLKEKGWTYTMEGTFVEVYNEEIHDLLGSSKDFDKKKHEIRHDDKKKQTTVTGLEAVPLDSPNAVEAILKRADNNRSVAATKSNERSSRSHSVFMLKLVGRNSTTNETSEGTLNLVDLAGSERLKVSGAEGDRMKETQNINKSLSCLGDVIGALGSGKDGAHIPYRNSKLTYLLQYSLGGNSKTLMFVMASPLEAHLGETLTSLKFATKVHNTHIGTAKKSTKVGS